jgi:hypothetical protein
VAIVPAALEQQELVGFRHTGRLLGAAQCHGTVDGIGSIVGRVHFATGMHRDTKRIAQSRGKDFHPVRTESANRIAIVGGIVRDETIVGRSAQVGHEHRGREVVFELSSRTQDSTRKASIGVAANRNVQFSIVACIKRRETQSLDILINLDHVMHFDVRTKVNTIHLRKTEPYRVNMVSCVVTQEDFRQPL